MKAVVALSVVFVLMASAKAKAIQTPHHSLKHPSKSVHHEPDMKFLPKNEPALRGTITVPFRPVIADSKAMSVSNFHASRSLGNGFQMDDASMNAAIFAVIGGIFIALQALATCFSSLRKSDTLVNNSQAAVEASGEKSLNEAELEPEASGEKSLNEAELEPEAPKASSKVLTVIDLETVKALPIYSIFDCFLMKPQEEIAPVRLQGRIVASSGSAKSPIAGEDCVYSSTMAQQDGRKVSPVELNKKSFDFELDLSNRMRVRIRGDQVALFCMKGGNRFRKDMSQADPAFSKLDGSTVFQFMERCLRVGAVVTSVGRLRYVEKDKWELVPCNIGGEGQAETVWVSDNPTLVSPGLSLTPRSPRE